MASSGLEARRGLRNLAAEGEQYLQVKRKWKTDARAQSVLCCVTALQGARGQPVAGQMASYQAISHRFKFGGKEY